MKILSHILGGSLCTFSLIGSPSGSFTHPTELPWDAGAFAAHTRELLGVRAPAGSGTLRPGQTDTDGDFTDRLAARHVFEFIEGRLPQDFKSKGSSIAETLFTESRRYRLDPLFVSAIILTESTFRPLVVGAHGEIGLMQIKPGTAEWIAKLYDIEWKNADALKDPHYNIKIGAAYLDYLRKKFANESSHYIAAYNMGPGRVRRLAKKGQVTSSYTRKAMKFYRQLHRRLDQHIQALAVSRIPQQAQAMKITGL